MPATVCSAGDQETCWSGRDTAVFAVLLQGGSARGCSGDLQKALPAGIFLILILSVLRTFRGMFCSEKRELIRTPTVIC